ncbi:MAG: adenylyltransferase/cytidyltransferase family protein [Clostridia bacterium]|nr:adenylyltransferase/cytidyltransferase family protein [Clostridia bacterium]
MEEENGRFGYNVGVYDLVCRTIRQKVEEEAGKEGPYGIGVYTSEFCEEVLMTAPMKTLEERMAIAKSFNDVDFVFSVNTNNRQEVEALAVKAYEEYLLRKKAAEEPKKYKVGFVIGSFDVFHAGHLENIMMAKEMCERVFVVLKTDERIFLKKNKMPRQTTAERAAVLKFLKPVEDVLYMDIDTTRKDVIADVLQHCDPNIDKKEIVAIFGSDLQAKEEQYIGTDWADISVAFTERNPEKMKTVSSTHYQKICDARGGLKVLESFEEQTIK